MINRKEEVSRALATLVERALAEIELMPQPVVQVCGPISTGGSGEHENKKKLISAIKYVQSVLKESVFNQLKYEELFNKALGPKTNKYDYPLLENFYGPLLQSGLIKKMYFIEDWENSIGSKWEYDLAKKLGLEIEILDPQKYL